MALNNIPTAQTNILDKASEGLEAVEEAVPVQYLDLAPNRRIAYRKYEGYRQPTILYVPGFFSTMNLRKITVIEDFARAQGYSNVRYDQECTGLSTGM